MATPHPIVTIVGSLRKESFSLKIANALAKLAPASLKLDVTTLHGISFFNQDLEAAPGSRFATSCRSRAGSCSSRRNITVRFPVS
jgi:NAD(P)H-dependent FMN reductase